MIKVLRVRRTLFICGELVPICGELKIYMWGAMKKLFLLLLLSGCFKDGGHLLQTAEYYQCPDKLMQDVRAYLEEAKKCQAQ
jgi:hypothetical protein